MMKLLCLDCDSTLSQIEGVDELADIRGAQIKEEIVALTNQAMSGKVPIEDIFAKRLELIRPTKSACERVAALYAEKAAKGVKRVLRKLREEGWTPLIISGGFVQPIEPFAASLGISEIHAVPLHFDDNGEYLSFEETPTTRNGGKPEIILALKEKYSPEKIVMVGDGVSDLETQCIVDQFIAYGEFEERALVREQAKYFAKSFDELYGIIEK